VDLQILAIEARDAEPMAAAFAAIGWNKPVSQYVRYLSEQEEGRRDVLVAFIRGVFAGYVTVVWQPDYAPFRAGNIPEISDLNVLPRFRRSGIATRLLDEAEGRIAGRSAIAGIGVGMTPDYGPAQRLYVLRGYVPDGRGLASHDRILQHGDQVQVDDDLVLRFTKDLRHPRDAPDDDVV
jgi:GNAT superfamily N-acetyltransferase